MNSQTQYNAQQPMLGIKNNTQMSYQCGSCSKANDIKPREPIRCRDCGHRILYKKRTKRMVHRNKEV
ncbi:DNA-directed RNA polymerase core subunit rpc10 [Kickxella alabastrina]|uniref:DNA-directed RNA polymerase core subunit rpc10 n=1 Tax=Kickxella alabastrina TaxID=61397 RepID=A0ACC1ICH1_9FUNG|nr:DNA-directed RNA polymerase core subunit rpc10 [Kickxella alabastrina]